MLSLVEKKLRNGHPVYKVVRCLISDGDQGDQSLIFASIVTTNLSSVLRLCLVLFLRWQSCVTSIGLREQALRLLTDAIYIIVVHWDMHFMISVNLAICLFFCPWRVKSLQRVKISIMSIPVVVCLFSLSGHVFRTVY